jgi:hypothetical protein
VQHGYIKKLGNAAAFLHVAPMQLHRENYEQLLCGGQYLRIKCWVLGGLSMWFLQWWRKNELHDVGQKWVMTKLEPMKNMRHTHIQIIYLL